MNNLTEFIWEILEDVDLEYEGEMYNLVEVGDWIADYKYENRQIIVMKASSGKHYSVLQSRCGSSFTDWHHNDIDRMVEVEPETVSKIVWNVVK